MEMGCKFQHISVSVVCVQDFVPLCLVLSAVEGVADSIVVQGCSWPLLFLMSRQRIDKCVTDIRDTSWDSCSSVALVHALDPSQEGHKNLGS